MNNEAYFDSVLLLSHFLIPIFIFMTFYYFCIIFKSYMEISRHNKITDTNILTPYYEYAEKISILIPAYNESPVIVDCVRSTLRLKYPSFEIVVVNDGSTDDTLETLVKEFDLVKTKNVSKGKIHSRQIKQVYKSSIYSNLVVIDKVNGRVKADALNAGLNFVDGSLICTIDADCILHFDALLHAIKPFIDNKDSTIAVTGSVRLKNPKTTGLSLRNLLLECQFFEYGRAILMARLAQSNWKMLIIASGAFCVMKTDDCILVGGFDTDTLGEDYQMILKVLRMAHRLKREHDVVFLPEAVCETEVPENFSVLIKQRIRWHQGALEGFFRNLDLFGNLGYGRVGILSLPLALITDVLLPLARLIMALLLPLLVVWDYIYVEYLIFAYFFVIIFNLYALFLSDKMYVRTYENYTFLEIFFVIILEPFIYRPVIHFCAIFSFYPFLVRKRIWGEMERIQN